MTELFTLETHQVEATRFLNPDAGQTEALANCGLGLGAEVLELSTWLYPRSCQHVFAAIPWDDAHNREIVLELGDICWYSTVLADKLGLSLAELVNNEVVSSSLLTSVMDAQFRRSRVERNFHRLEEAAEKVTRIVKWHVFHYHPLDDEHLSVLKTGLKDAIIAVSKIALFGCAVPFEEILNANIEKLRKRYPSGVFKTEDSLNRSD